MPHAHTQITVHAIFSTKDRTTSIPEAFQRRLWEFMAGICRNLRILALEIGGMDDHAHLLLQVPAKMSVAEAISKIKSNSSRWAHKQGMRFDWQEGYAAFSVSASSVPTVARYIRNQKAHHRKISFREEWAAILRKHGLEVDEGE